MLLLQNVDNQCLESHHEPFLLCYNAAIHNIRFKSLVFHSLLLASYSIHNLFPYWCLITINLQILFLVSYLTSYTNSNFPHSTQGQSLLNLFFCMFPSHSQESLLLGANPLDFPNVFLSTFLITLFIPFHKSLALP